MWIALFSDRYSTLELTEIAERQFKDRLQTIPGVGGVNLGGEKRPGHPDPVDAERMAARGVTAGDLIRAFAENSVELPSGRLENLDREISVRTRGKLARPESSRIW
jgi:multidrug efflux pump